MKRNSTLGLVLNVQMRYSVAMKRRGFMAAPVVGAFLLGLSLTEGSSVAAAPPSAVTVTKAGGAAHASHAASADSAPAGGNPYQAIVVRNPFGIVPRPPAPPPKEKKKKEDVPPSALKLTGITKMGANQYAMFVLDDRKSKRPRKPGEPPYLYSNLVRVGEKDTVITNLEVVGINALAGKVQVVFQGKPMTLDFENNGLEPPTGPVHKGPGGRGRPPGGLAGLQRTHIPNSRVIPPRPQRYGGYYNRNRMNARTTAGNASGNQTRAQPLTPPQEILSLRAQQAIAQQQGIPFPPIPGQSSSPGGQTPPAPPSLPVPGQ